ncbi:MAG TPA: hypothetical protein G4N96_12520 [Chloroflexi bacterium]|nr:MAG: hypothetical protein B6I38_10685 [Anaerolineaceae bacterium 4572_5.1]HEY85922.1 hypothetical protein [Chloroflexota bacterium]
MNEAISESASPLKGIADRLFALLQLVFFPAFLLFIFGFSIKLTGAYTCIMDVVEQDTRVTAAIGEPVTPGFFAWTTSYEGGFGHSTGHFYTFVSGPQGRGRIEASFGSSTLYDLLINIKFKIHGRETELYRGAYECSSE